MIFPSDSSYFSRSVLRSADKERPEMDSSMMRERANPKLVVFIRIVSCL